MSANVTVTFDDVTGDYTATASPASMAKANWLGSVIQELIWSSAFAEPHKPTSAAESSMASFRPGALLHHWFFGRAFTGNRTRYCEMLEELIEGARASHGTVPRNALLVDGASSTLKAWGDIFLGGWSHGAYTNAHDALKSLRNFLTRDMGLSYLRLIVIGDSSLGLETEGQFPASAVDIIRLARSWGFTGSIVGVSDNPEFREAMQTAGCNATTGRRNAVPFVRGFIHLM